MSDDRIAKIAAEFDGIDLYELFDSGQLKFASDIARPAPKQSVIEIDAINAFMKRNPRADGGRIGFRYAGPVKFENIIKPKIYEGNRFSKKMPKGTFTMRLFEGLDENGDRIENTYVGKKEKLKKIFDKKNRARVKQVKSERASTASYDKPYKVLQGENKGKYLINYGGGTESPKVTKYFDPEEYGSDKAAYKAANKELTDYKNRPDKYLKLKENFRKNVVQPEGFVTGQEMLKEARKKGINISENRQASNFADNFGFPKKTSGGVVFYDISKLDNQKEIDKILKAQVKSGSGSDLAKEKFPIKTKTELQEPRLKNIEEKGGVKKGSPIAGKRALKVDMGHAGNIFSKNANELITLDKLTYTPSEINEILGQKGGVDDKIRAIEKSQKKIIEKFNDADAASYMDKNNIVYDKSKSNFKKQLLNKSDSTLTRLVLQSSGYKTARLSTGIDFGKSFLKNVPDPFNVFGGMTEKDFVNFRRQYITDEGNLQRSLLNKDANKKRLKISLADTKDFSKVLKTNLPDKELKNLANLKIMEENRINQLKAASNISKKEIDSTISKFDNSNQIKLARIGCPGKATGGRVGFFEGQNLNVCAAKGLQKLKTTDIKKFTPADKANVKAITKTVQGGRLLKNILGPGALAFEGLFALPFAAYDYSKGRSGEDTFKSAISLGFLDEKLRENELKKIFPEYGKGTELEDIGERLTNLQRLQKGTRGQKLRSTPKFEKAEQEFETALKPFLETGDPTTAYFDNLKQSQDAEQELENQYKDVRAERGVGEFAEPFDFSYGEFDAFSKGGIASLSGGDKSGPAPESGPQPQGLPYVYNRVKKQ